MLYRSLEEPYMQQISEVMNSTLKERNNFIPQEVDCFVMSLFDFKKKITGYGN